MLRSESPHIRGEESGEGGWGIEERGVDSEPPEKMGEKRRETERERMSKRVVEREEGRWSEGVSAREREKQIE